MLRARSFILRSSRSGDECRDPASAAVDERTHEPSPIGPSSSTKRDELAQREGVSRLGQNSKI